MRKEQEKKWDRAADRILRLLRKSKGLLTVQEIKEGLGDGSDFEVMGLLVYHYGLVRQDGGRYSLSEEGRKAAKSGIRRYLNTREAKPERDRTRREILIFVCGGVTTELVKILLHYLLSAL